MSDELTDLRARLEVLATKWCKRSAKYESGWEKGYGEAGRAHAEELRALLAAPPAPVAVSPFALKAADNMARIIDEMVKDGKLDARSRLADARLDYGQPW